MPTSWRLSLCAALASTMFALLLGGIAGAASPSSLDLRVDSISRAALLGQPASALVDPARQAAAVRRAHWTVIGWVLIQVFEAVALFWLWNSGKGAQLRDWLRRRFDREWQVRFLFGAALALVARLAAFVPSFYLYRVDRTLDLTFMLTRWWFAFWLFHTLVAMAIAGFIAMVVLWLVSRTHQWYVYTIVGVLAVSIAYTYATPMLFPTFAGSTPAELQFAAAYHLGHVVQGDRLSIALIVGGVIIVFSALAVVIADRIRFRRDDDPLSRLAIVGSLLALVYLIAVPVRNAALRSYDFDADRYAVTLTRDPSAAVRALVRTADQRMEEVCPERTATLFLYTDPAIGARVAAINHVPNPCP